MKNAITQRANSDRNIRTLPEKMAGIEIHADVSPSGGAQSQSGLHVVNDKTGMRFDSHFNSMVGGEFSGFLPVRNYFLVPLPFKSVQEFRRPGGDNPVRTFRFVTIAWAAGKGD